MNVARTNAARALDTLRRGQRVVGDEKAADPLQILIAPGDFIRATSAELADVVRR